MKTKISYSIWLFLLIINSSCDKDDTIILPSLTTIQINNITETSAYAGGSITNNGDNVIIGRGVCWSIEPLPDTLDNKSNDGTGYGEFTSNINGLIANTIYYVRAYATNNQGTTVYGNELIFKTKAELPNLTTDQTSLLTQTTAQSGGNITFDGGVSIIARGVCWGIESLPTISNEKTIDGEGVGMFTSDLSELLPNTTYYVRAYATNNEGSTGYGNEQSFTSLPESIVYPSSSPYGENILDIPITQINADINYSLAAILPENTNLKITISGVSSTFLWAYDIGSVTNWNITPYDVNANSQSFTSILSDSACDLRVVFSKGTVIIDYFENGADTPTITKQLIIE